MERKIVEFIHTLCKKCKAYKTCEDKFFRCLKGHEKELNRHLKCRRFQPKMPTKKKD